MSVDRADQIGSRESDRRGRRRPAPGARVTSRSSAAGSTTRRWPTWSTARWRIGLRWLTVEMRAGRMVGRTARGVAGAPSPTPSGWSAPGATSSTSAACASAGSVAATRGCRSGCSASVAEAEALTAGNHGMTLTLAVDHDGRVELADAMAALAAEVRDGRRRPSSIDEDALAAHLDRARPARPRPHRPHRWRRPRTAGFLVWQSAYSELVFTDVRWPAFGRDDLFDAVAEYQRRERRFGAVDSSCTPNISSSLSHVAREPRDARGRERITLV